MEVVEFYSFYYSEFTVFEGLGSPAPAWLGRNPCTSTSKHLSRDVGCDLNGSNQNQGGQIYDSVIHTFFYTYASLYNFRG